MPSKRSFFNVTLFRKNLSRSWPLWGAVTAAGSLVPLYLLLALMTNNYGRVEASDFVSILYGAATIFAPAFTLGYAILVAMVVWSYLYTPRSVGLMHTLPIGRTALFLTNTASGFAMLLIPYVVVGGGLIIIALAWGCFDLVAVLNTVLAVVLMTALFFGMATLCAMVTGNVFALPAFYLVVNFLAPAADWLISSLGQEFLVGVNSDYSGAVEFLAPVVQIYRSFQWEGVYSAGDEYYYALTGMGVVVIYGLIGLAMLGAALALYHCRRSESAGDVVAFRWLRPVFRVGVALASALTLGRLLYALLWASLFQEGGYADGVPMAVCMMITGIIGYYAASMLLEKSLRVFRRSWPGVVTVCAGIVVICACLGTDILGVERRVPKLEEIDTVELYISGSNFSPELDAEKDAELVELVRQIHGAIVENVDEIRAQTGSGYAWEAGSSQMREWSSEYIRFSYNLEDGTRLYRYYNLYLDREDWEAGVSYEGAIRKLVGDERIQRKMVEVPAGCELTGVYVYCYRDGRHSSEAEHAVDEKLLYEALLRDSYEGNILSYNPFDPLYYESFPVSINVEYLQRPENPYEVKYHMGSYLDLRPSMFHTMQALVDMGFLTLEELEAWKDELAYGDSIRLPGVVSPIG